MKFCIDSIILWPKNKNHEYKRHTFVDGKINVITGASRTGKSAIIPIIDYCLGSNKCTIPVNTIRNTCEWFGVLFQLDKEQILLCRQEPGHNQTTGEMYVARGETVIIPETINSNTNVKEVNYLLNELFGMSFLELDPSSNNFSARPSYRDLMAFVFQPQNIVANGDVLFYKADTMEHRQRLINVFPYALGAVTPEVLVARQTLERLKKQRDRVQRDLNAVRDVSESWKQEIMSWISRAMELGLAQYAPDKTVPFEKQVLFLEKIVKDNNIEAELKARNVVSFSENLGNLKIQESKLSSELFALQKRYADMQQLKNTTDSYRTTLQIQVDRLEISEWLRERFSTAETCPFCQEVHEGIPASIEQLCSAIKSIESTSEGLQTIPAAFEREMQSVEAEIQVLTENLTALRKRIAVEAATSDANARAKYTAHAIARFLGNLEASLHTYNRIGKDSDLESQLQDLTERIDELEAMVDEKTIQRKQRAAISYINAEAGKIISQLDSEHPDAPIEFVPKDLTLKVRTLDGRDDYLWEIGSGSNWLAYHISIILAFQRFFHDKKPVAMPSFIVLDQPSQVYFPRTSDENSGNEERALFNDEDKVAVQKIFTTLSKYIDTAKEPFQIIVTEHADEDIWGAIPGIHVAGKWRGPEKLVPIKWIEE